MKFHHIFASLIIGAASLTPVPASAVSISEVLHIIESNNLQLRAASADNAAAEAGMRAENTLPPLSVEFSPFFRPGVAGMASSELVVSQEFDFPTLYGSRNRQASLERNALDGATAVERRDLLLDAETQCITLVRLQREAELTANRHATSQTLLEAYEKSLALGRATVLDVNRIRLELQDLELQQLQCSADMAAAVGALRTLNGGAELDLSGLDYERDAMAVFNAEAAEGLLQSDASLSAARAEIEAARHNVSVAKSGWLPSLSLGYRRNSEGDEAANGFLVGAALPLVGNSSKTRAAKARLSASELQLEAARADAESRLNNTLVEIGRMQATLRATDPTLIEETLTLYAKSLEAGQITITEYYQATTGLYDRLQTRITIEAALQQALATLLIPTR